MRAACAFGRPVTAGRNAAHAEPTSSRCRDVTPALIAENGQITGKWTVALRDRVLTV